MADTNTDNGLTTLPEIDISAYRITPKYEEWRRLYLDKANRETFGNATKSAIQAYNLDPVAQYGVARLIGHENITKHNNLTAITQEYLSSNGFSFPILLNHALTKMADPKVNGTHWWKEIMIMAGYKKDKAQIEILNNTQINNNLQITDDERQQLSADFAEFIISKARQVPEPTPQLPDNSQV